jgi:hypothetical protein
MTALMSNLIKNKTLRVRLTKEDWEYLEAEKKKGFSYNWSIRKALIDKQKILIPF